MRFYNFYHFGAWKFRLKKRLSDTRLKINMIMWPIRNEKLNTTNVPDLFTVVTQSARDHMAMLFAQCVLPTCQLCMELRETLPNTDSEATKYRNLLKLLKQIKNYQSLHCCVWRRKKHVMIKWVKIVLGVHISTSNISSAISIFKEWHLISSTGLPINCWIFWKRSISLLKKWGYERL